MQCIRMRCQVGSEECGKVEREMFVRCDDRNGGTGGMGGEAVQGASARSAVIQKLGIAMGTGMWCLVYT